MRIPVWAGTKVRQDQLGSGTFFCPNCKDIQAYKYVHARKTAHVYGISVMPLKDYGELVVCENCESAYSPEVLLKDVQLGLIVQHQKVIINKKLSHGFCLSDIVEEESKYFGDDSLGWMIVKIVNGEDIKVCTGCGLGYASSITYCPDCGAKLAADKLEEESSDVFRDW